MKTREMLASEYQDEIMRNNPQGFRVSPYCNREMLADAFEAGHSARDSEFLELRNALIEARDALKFECGGRCAQGINPCSALEASERIDEVLGNG